MRHCCLSLFKQRTYHVSPEFLRVFCSTARNLEIDP